MDFQRFILTVFVLFVLFASSTDALWGRRSRRRRGGGWLRRTLDDTKEKADNAWDSAKDKASDIWDDVKDKTDNAWDKATDKAGDVWDNVKDKTENAWDKVTDKAEDAWDNVKDKTENAWDKVKDKTEDAWDNVKKKIGKRDASLRTSDGYYESARSGTRGSDVAVLIRNVREKYEGWNDADSTGDQESSEWEGN